MSYRIRECVHYEVLFIGEIFLLVGLIPLVLNCDLNNFYLGELFIKGA